jgi:hypothetical protein
VWALWEQEIPSLLLTAVPFKVHINCSIYICWMNEWVNDLFKLPKGRSHAGYNFASSGPILQQETIKISCSVTWSESRRGLKGSSHTILKWAAGASIPVSLSSWTKQPNLPNCLYCLPCFPIISQHWLSFLWPSSKTLNCSGVSPGSSSF